MISQGPMTAPLFQSGCAIPRHRPAKTLPLGKRPYQIRRDLEQIVVPFQFE
jgi:hypothetical protein